MLIIVGVWMVLYGADRLTEGASALARRMNVPEIIIGLTIVAAGTSAPELFVSLVSALKGTPDLAVGNVVGSNTMNCMLIVGCAAMVAPMTISKSTVKKDIPFAVVASMVLLLLSLNSYLGRLDGVVLLAGFAIFMMYTLWQAKKGQAEPAPEQQKQQNPWASMFFVVVGLALLVLGSNIFVSHASSLAYALGISEGVVGLTVVAGGTSLPGFLFFKTKPVPMTPSSRMRSRTNHFRNVLHVFVICVHLLNYALSPRDSFIGVRGKCF